MPTEVERYEIKVLVLSQYYDPEPIPKPHEVAVELSRRGHEVQVLTGLPNYPTGILQPNYRLRRIQKEVRQGVSVTRVFEIPYHGVSGLGRLANYGTFALSAAAGAFSLSAPDVIYVWHPPLSVGIAASLISWTRHAPFVYDLQDIWPESLIFAGLSSHGPAARLMRFAEQLVYPRARHIIVPTSGAKANLESKGVPPSKMTVLPHWANPEDFVEPDATQFARARSLLGADDSHFVVSFAGNFGFAQGLETLVDAAEILRDQARIVLRLIGDGAARAGIAAEIASRNLRNVRIIDRIPRRETAMLLAASDLLVVLLRNRELGEIALPGKTVAYMAAGRPILMAAGGAGAALVRASESGVVVNPGDAAALAASITKLSEASRATLSELGGHGLAYARKNLSRGSIVSRLEAILASAVGG